MKKLTALIISMMVSLPVWAQWSKYPVCSQQYDKDIAACKKVKDSKKRESCYSSASERLAYCGKNAGKTGFPALLNK